MIESWKVIKPQQNQEELLHIQPKPNKKYIAKKIVFIIAKRDEIPGLTFQEACKTFILRNS